VLPIGGVKEKVIAAHRTGLRTVILPKRNEQDLDDVPEEIKKSMKFVFVETVDDVLDSALEANHKTRRSKTTKKSTATRKSKSNGKNSSR
jgi:ATP-dependent Lon protease